jgi:outer membrane lipoprotein-sorting protein
MTNMDEQHDHNHPDDNLDRLIQLGEPLPRMPENLKARIRTRLAEVGQETVKKNFFFRRWAIVSPLAAAAVLALFLIFFWPSGTPSTISWADVQRQIEQIHTLTARIYIEDKSFDGKWIADCMKIYLKDPGLSRVDGCETGADLDILKSGFRLITVQKNESGPREMLMLNPLSRRAYWSAMYLDTYRTSFMFPSLWIGSLPSKDINLAAEQWQWLKQITTVTKTKRIGKRVINGKPAMGFGFEVPIMDPIYKESTHGKIWVGHDDGVPLFLELEHDDYKGHMVRRIEWSEIRWNVPLEESLFDLTVPAGWSLERKRNNESIEYTGFGLKPDVTLEAGPEGHKPLTAAGNVASVVKADRNTGSEPYPFLTGLITIELTPEAAKRLRDYADAHPDETILVNLNGKIKAPAVLDAAHPTQLSFDISPIRLTENMLVKKYITPNIKRNQP